MVLPDVPSNLQTTFSFLGGLAGSGGGIFALLHAVRHPAACKNADVSSGEIIQPASDWYSRMHKANPAQVLFIFINSRYQHWNLSIRSPGARSIRNALLAKTAKNFPSGLKRSEE